MTLPTFFRSSNSGELFTVSYNTILGVLILFSIFMAGLQDNTIAINHNRHRITTSQWLMVGSTFTHYIMDEMSSISYLPLSKLVFRSDVTNVCQGSNHARKQNHAIRSVLRTIFICWTQHRFAVCSRSTSVLLVYRPSPDNSSDRYLSSVFVGNNSWVNNGNQQNNHHQSYWIGMFHINLYWRM